MTISEEKWKLASLSPFPIIPSNRFQAGQSPKHVWCWRSFFLFRFVPFVHGLACYSKRSSVYLLHSQ